MLLQIGCFAWGIAGLCKRGVTVSEFRDILRQFPKWRSSIMGQGSLVDNKQPWLTFRAINFLENLVSKEMTAFEYGSGGSTLFLASRMRSGASVEHDALWAAQVRKALERDRIDSWHVNIVEPETAASPHDPLYESTDSLFAGKTFRAYAGVVDGVADRSLDLVVLDGRARVACFHHAVTKVKLGGYLILDNAERDEYAPIHQALRNWQRQNFWGPGPHNLYFWLTSVWRRIED